MLYSIIIPVYNNSDTLSRLYENICKNINTGEGNFEIIFIDDGSDDTSFEVLTVLKKSDIRISIVQLDKNYGQPIAIISGLQSAVGDYAIVISADLQEEGGIIYKFINFQKQFPESDLIIGTRNSNSDYFIFRIFSKIFYKIIQFKIPQMPAGGYDTCLMSKKLAASLVAGYNPQTFIQVALLKLAEKPTQMPYHRLKSSTSHVKLRSIYFKIRYFIKCISIVYSNAPVREPDKNLLTSLKK